mgnify:CR=1 FL=1
MTDPIADMLIRIKNAQAAGKEAVLIPYSKIKMEIAQILFKKGYIADVVRKGRKLAKTIEVALKYNEKGEPAISYVRRISKPSKRIYVPSRLIRRVRQGFGMQIISTPKGLLANEDARKTKVGGEVICELW